MKAPSPEEVAQRIGVPTKQWPGQCHAIAAKCLRAHVVRGRLSYGFYLGPISPTSPFTGKPLVRHGWVELRDGQVWDPTRWVFEAVPPYIYIGSAHDYDFGMNRLKEALLRPPPLPTEAFRTLRLPVATRRYVGSLLGLPSWQGTVSKEQLAWVANLPLQLLGEHAKPVYQAIVQVGLSPFIPIDNRRCVLGEKE